MVRLGHLATDGLQDLVRGRGRFDRSSRLQAAHGILVVTSAPRTWSPVAGLRLLVAVHALTPSLARPVLDWSRRVLLPHARAAAATPEVREVLAVDRDLARRVGRALAIGEAHHDG
jgi:hypothetical protein